MRATVRPLVLLHPDAGFGERVREAAHGRFDVRAVADWEAAARAVRATVPAGVALVDPYHGADPADGPAPALHRLLRTHPAATILAAFPPGEGWAAHLRVLGDAGVAGALLIGEQDTPAFIRAVLEGVRPRALRVLTEAYAGVVRGARARAILDAAAGAVVAGRGAAALAGELGVHRDTLLRWCRGAGLPVPRTLLLWMRLLLAAELLDNPGLRVEEVAAACGYGSAAALASSLAEHLGMRPDALRRAGALRRVAPRFQATLQRGDGEASVAGGR